LNFLISVTNDIWIYTFQHISHNKRYFKSYRSINNHTISIIISDLFSIEGIGIIQIKIFISEEMKIRFQINDIYYSPQIRTNLLLFIKLFRQLKITDIWGDTVILSTRNIFKFYEIQYHEDFWKIRYILLIIFIIYVPSEVISPSIFIISTNKSSLVEI
jgi:hypothetical protein